MTVRNNVFDFIVSEIIVENNVTTFPQQESWI